VKEPNATLVQNKIGMAHLHMRHRMHLGAAAKPPQKVKMFLIIH
jgi:hypothetical protein